MNVKAGQQKVLIHLNLLLMKSFETWTTYKNKLFFELTSHLRTQVTKRNLSYSGHIMKGTNSLAKTITLGRVNIKRGKDCSAVR